MPANILLVEDEPAIQELIAANLMRAGHTVLRAADAEIAQRIVRDALPDLILLDWMLPGQSGIEFARRLRGEERALQVEEHARDADEDGRDPHAHGHRPHPRADPGARQARQERERGERGENERRPLGRVREGVLGVRQGDVDAEEREVRGDEELDRVLGSEVAEPHAQCPGGAAGARSSFAARSISVRNRSSS